MLVSNPGRLRLRHWLSDGLTTWLDLIHRREICQFKVLPHFKPVFSHTGSVAKLQKQGDIPMNLQDKRDILKESKCEIFDGSYFHDFYTIKPFWVGDFGSYAERAHQFLKRTLSARISS
jgi:hypothetical protein